MGVRESWKVFGIRGDIQEPFKKKNVSTDVYFEYLNLLLLNKRLLEAEQFLNKLALRLDEDASPAEYRRFELLKVELLKAKGKYKQAVAVLDNGQDYGNPLYTVPVYLSANNFTQAVRLLEIIEAEPEYSAKEKRSAGQLLNKIDHFWSCQLRNRTQIIHSEAYGTLLPVHTFLSRPLANWGKLQFHHYALQERHSMEFKVIQVEGLLEKSSLSMLTNGDLLGIKGQWEYRRDRGSLTANFFYNDLETELTALLSKFSRKNGAAFEAAITVSPKWSAGGVAATSKYYLPEGDCIGEMHSVHPYVAYNIFDDVPSLQQQIGYLGVRGTGDPKYVAHQFDMFYYGLSGMYKFGIQQDTFKYSLSLGYLSGEDFSGFAVTPRLGLQYNIFNPLDFTADVEYRTDMATGGNELRTMIDLTWRY